MVDYLLGLTLLLCMPLAPALIFWVWSKRASEPSNAFDAVYLARVPAFFGLLIFGLFGFFNVLDYLFRIWSGPARTLGYAIDRTLYVMLVALLMAFWGLAWMGLTYTARYALDKTGLYRTDRFDRKNSNVAGAVFVLSIVLSLLLVGDMTSLLPDPSSTSMTEAMQQKWREFLDDLVGPNATPGKVVLALIMLFEAVVGLTKTLRSLLQGLVKVR